MTIRIVDNGGWAMDEKQADWFGRTRSVEELESDLEVADRVCGWLSQYVYKGSHDPMLWQKLLMPSLQVWIARQRKKNSADCSAMEAHC